MTVQYVSALDNPNITLQHALDYYQGKKKIAKLEKEISLLDEKTGFKPLIKETLQFRLMQILFLTDSLDPEEMISTHVAITAIFKMAMPQHRLHLESGNEKERQVAIKMLNHNAEYVLTYFKYSHPNLHPWA